MARSRKPRPTRGTRRLALGVSLAVASLSACAYSPAWRLSNHPTRHEAEVLLVEKSTAPLVRRTLPRDVPEIPVRRRLRPCCAYGSEIRARLGPIPVPGYRIPNVLGPEDLGPHKYDSGLVVWKREGRDEIQLNRERNGLVYTCQGGFIDTAHVRDYVDWALWIASRLAILSETGGSIELPQEGGARRILVTPPPPETFDRFGLRRPAVEAAIWTAFQLSVWHEIATWYGWASVPGFSERASAFSPEDLYSNVVGAKLLAGVVLRHATASENVFNESVDQWLAEVLRVFGAVPRELGVELVEAVDGTWWDSSRRVPDPRLVLRRHMDFASPVRPWQVPESLLSEALRAKLDAACPGGRDALPLPYPEALDGDPIRNHVTLEIEPDAELARREPFLSLGATITQDDFPAIVESIRAKNGAEFGPGTDAPQ